MKYLVLTLLILLNANAFVVLLDPGHGGSEHGAVRNLDKINSKGKKYSQRILEKDLSLEVAKEIKKFLNKKYNVYLTRSFDRDISLEERSKMADTVKADIFVSIHFNSYNSSQFSGFETYYLHNNKNKAISKVERIENKEVSGNEKVVNQILIDLVIQKTTKASKKLAEFVHSNTSKDLSSMFNMKNRGIKPGLFYVLALSKRPGILLEGGFMSNPKELSLISSKKYIKKYSESVARGIESYLSTLDPKDISLF